MENKKCLIEKKQDKFKDNNKIIEEKKILKIIVTQKIK